MFENPMFDPEEEFLGAMLLSGAASAIYRDEEGELIISWVPDVLKERFPQVYEIVMEAQEDEIDGALDNLVEDGLVQMFFRETPDGGIEKVFSLTEAGKKAVEERSKDEDN